MNNQDLLEQKKASLKSQLELIEMLETHKAALDELGLELISTSSVAGSQNTQAQVATPAKQPQSKKHAKSAKSGKRTKGLKSAGIDVFRFLSPRYTREDVSKLIAEKHPAVAATMSPNSIRAILTYFVNEGWAKLAKPSAGNYPAIYEKTEVNNGLKFE